MKIARYTAYGGPENVVLDDAPIPTPGPDELLIRVRAAPVTAGDARMRSGKVPRGLGTMMRLAIGWSCPNVAPGWAFAGDVAALGPGVTSFTEGQRVFGLKGFKGGAHAEYLTVREGASILPLPDSLSYEQGAAFFFGGLTAADFLIDRAKLAPGERILIAGATGAVGGAAVQIARHLGATIAATASPANHALARQLGAIEVTDYRTGPPKGSFDVILDVMGSLGWKGAQPLLSPKGRLILITAELSEMLASTVNRRVLTGTSKEDLASMRRLVGLHEKGGYAPVLGPVLPFEKLAEAHRIAESFHKPGNLVVTMGDAS
ncbi:MAG TPA: NAD(P)-dependent alcohol dehydrogenase [Tabrizicola sp.]|nr:NAD(P)-dependent alcohol dehydrogenase [Tabrizicola sp.]